MTIIHTHFAGRAVSILLGAMLLSACGSDGPDALHVTQDPVVTLDPNGVTPLAAVVEMETRGPVSVTLDISTGGDSRIVKFGAMETSHKIPVLGLLPNTAYTIEVTIEDSAGNIADITKYSGGLNIITNPLPADFPNIEVHVSNPALMEPGFTLLDRFARETDADVLLGRYSIILNSAGQVVWFSPSSNSNMRQLPNGDLMYRNGQTVIEMTMLGEQVKIVELADPTMALHHDLTMTSVGTFLSTTKEKVVFDNYPTNYDDPIPRQVADVRNDPIVEFSAEGDLLNIWRLEDMLDTSRIGYIGLGERNDEGLDWAHVNAVVYDPSDDSIIASVRHQDAVIKFDRQTGALKWILGPHENWSAEFQQYLLTPIGTPFAWQYHQHAPMITGDGTIILFDNGNNRTSPFDGLTPTPDELNYSRAVEYDIDEVNMEVTQVWEYGESSTPRLFAHFIGDADWMPTTGNALVHFGGITYIDGVTPDTIGYGDVIAKIVEVTRDANKTKVFDVTVSSSTPGTRISIYRSERIPSLYAPGISDTAITP